MIFDLIFVFFFFCRFNSTIKTEYLADMIGRAKTLWFIFTESISWLPVQLLQLIEYSFNIHNFHCYAHVKCSGIVSNVMWQPCVSDWDCNWDLDYVSMSWYRGSIKFSRTIELIVLWNLSHSFLDSNYKQNVEKIKIEYAL